jgi:hypothetical protein
MGERPSSPSCEARQGESITKYRKTEVGLWRRACWSTIVAHILYTRAPLDIERFRQSRHTLIALHFVQTSSDQKKKTHGTLNHIFGKEVQCYSSVNLHLPVQHLPH